MSPRKKHHRIDEKRQQEVEQYAADHDQQALCCRLGAEFPRLRWLRHLFLVHRLVDHPCDFAISAERQPPEAILRIAVLRFKFEDREPRVEKEVKLVDTYFEEPCEKKMPELMY